MSLIFISYSSKHRGLTEQLVKTIEAQYGEGSVWWDHALESWGDYEVQITNALNGAKAVVVIWSKEATDSIWVKSEANKAHRQNKLVHVRPTASKHDVPSPYDQAHVHIIDNIDGILRSIDTVWRGKVGTRTIPLHEIYFDQHGHRLLTHKQSQLPEDKSIIGPTRLVQAKYGVVPFSDDTGMRRELIDWAQNSDRTTAGKLIHGPGGLGKTRLMVEVCEKLRNKGWMAGFFDSPHEQVEDTLKQRWQALDQLIAHSDDNGIFIVVDYAEGRQEDVEKLTQMLSQAQNASRPIRLVLLARGDQWWSDFYQKKESIEPIFHLAGKPYGDVNELKPLPAGKARTDYFLSAVTTFVPFMVAMAKTGSFPGWNGVPPTKERMVRIKQGDAYARPLAIQMEALLYLTSSSPNEGQHGISYLLERILLLEHAHWVKLLGKLDKKQDRALQRGVAQITTIQGTNSRESSVALLMADGYYKRQVAEDAEEVTDNLYTVYQTNEDGLAHLEPDLIGEHHVANTCDKELIDGCLHWVGEKPKESQEKRHRDLLTVLQRATQPEHGPDAIGRVTELLDHLISHHVKMLGHDMVAVMMDTPGILIERLTMQIDRLDDQQLSAIDSALPLQYLSFMEFSLQIAKRRADLARKSLVLYDSDTSIAQAVVDDDQDGSVDLRNALLNHLAARLNTFGIRLSALGQPEEALEVSREAVEIYQQLAKNRPDAFMPDLAMSLNNLGIRLSDLGRREKALEASQKAVEIYRQLAKTRPGDFLPNLATSINNMGNRLSDLEQHEEALEASQEAAETYRQLAKTRPDAFLPDLAMSLNNLGNRLSNLEQHEEALEASQEAVETYRQLAKTRPDAFLPVLAMSLNNLGNRLYALGRLDKALEASLEAVEIKMQLAKTRPDVFLPDLAKSLGTLSQTLFSADQYVQAANAAFEGLTAIAPFVEANAAAFGDLARNLGRDYMEASEKAEIEPDAELLNRVVRAIDGEDASANPAQKALKAKIDEIFASAGQSGSLDETALADLPDELAKQVRAFWDEHKNTDS